MTSAPTETSPLLGAPGPSHSPTAPSNPPDTEPITTNPEHRRVHWVDNLRAVLTILLILHHAALETGRAISPRDYSKVEIIPLSLFVAVNKSTLFNLFFFVSGHSASLVLKSNQSDYAFFQSRTLKVGLPALIYGMIGQVMLYFSLVFSWEDIFGSYKALWGFTRLAGPVAYVTILISFDYTYLLIRFIRRCPGSGSSGGSYRRGIYNKISKILSFPIAIGALVFVVFLILTFFDCLGVPLSLYPMSIVIPYDIPGPGAPLSFLFAYLTGVHFLTVKSYINDAGFTVNRGYIAFTISLAASFLALGIAQDLSPPLWEFINVGRLFNQTPFFVKGGFNPHTIFFAFWTAFMFFIVTILLVYIFAEAPWLDRDLGFWTRHTYPQTYINMIPILIAIFYLRGLHNLVLKWLLVGTAGVISSWLFVLIVAVLWKAAIN
ncbi:hypothetical protein CPB84DRAFT_1964272 [Gymnopilus junonius]|uniref:Acyltransferase 3 domain-containing protein n=1 Tax=Gymnopilus junonius TaxID=109634 RepID=A0A9P5NFT4_GYMJU|nr:hypothetical protein CPB84DRAFT_1964272 [Gymnopilus junonius]